MHRGPSHSLIVITAAAIPFFAVYGKRMVPYYAALLTHVLIGDYLTGGAQLLWPLFNETVKLTDVSVGDIISVATELILFVISLAFMIKLRDLGSFISHNVSNLTLIVPFAATLGPLLQAVFEMSFGLPSKLDTCSLYLLVAPSLFFMVLFGISILIELRYLMKSETQSHTVDSSRQPIVMPGQK